MVYLKNSSECNTVLTDMMVKPFIQEVFNRPFNINTAFGLKNTKLHYKKFRLTNKKLRTVVDTNQLPQENCWSRKKVVNLAKTFTLEQYRLGSVSKVPSAFAFSRRIDNPDNAHIKELKQIVLNSKKITNFDKKVETSEYRGRLPTEAVKTLEEIKQRQLTIQQVRSLLNKNKRPE